MLPAIKKKIEAELTDDLEDLTYEDALKAVADEVDLRRRDVLVGQANEVYENLIKVSKKEKKCQACNRHMNDREMATMEKTVRILL
jgi:DNA repair protein RAD50